MSNNRAVIDFHTHIFPAKLAARAVTNIGGYYSLPMECDGTAEGLLRSCETLPNMRFVISSATLKPENLHHGNDYLLEEAKLHPEFIPFSSFHPLLPIKKICAELDRVKALGSKGIKMHPDFQHFNLDEPNLFPAYRYCAEIGLPILFHVGDITTDFSTPCRLYNLMDKIPELTVIAAHLGGYQEWDEADRLLIGTARSGVTALKRFSSEAISRYVSRKASLNSLTHFRLRKTRRNGFVIALPKRCSAYRIYRPDLAIRRHPDEHR